MREGSRLVDGPQQQLCHRLPDQRTAAHHHCMLACDVEFVVIQQSDAYRAHTHSQASDVARHASDRTQVVLLLTSEWRAGHEARLVSVAEEVPRVRRCQPIDVLCGIDACEDGLRVDVRR